MSNDELLRREGFKIHQRKAGHQPLWEREGQVINQTAALRIATAAREQRIRDAAKVKT